MLQCVRPSCRVRRHLPLGSNYYSTILAFTGKGLGAEYQGSIAATTRVKREILRVVWGAGTITGHSLG
jgi:hypothetical protein